MNKIETANWKTFKVIEIFQTVKKGKRIQVPTGYYINMKNLKEGTILRITVTGINNGIFGYYEKMETNARYRTYENFISVSFLGTVFYQKGMASLDMKVHCLKPIHGELNEYSALFLVTIIRQVLSQSKYSDQISSTVLPYIEIKLPCDAGGEPDFAYMESYMRNLETTVGSALSGLQSVLV